MLSWFTRPSKKEQLTSLFSKYVPKELVNSAGSTGTSELNQLFEGSVEFVFALVQGSTPNETGQMLGTVATIAERGGWMVQALLCNLVVIVHGTLPSPKQPIGRLALTDQLFAALAHGVKIVHGSEVACFGAMGGTSRVTYGVLLPSFTEVLLALNALQFGKAGEFHG